MSFVTLLTDGLEVVTTAQGKESYEPLLGTIEGINVSPLWGIVPDDLQELPANDQRILECVWRGLIQYASDIMVRTAHLDQTASLIDFPLHLPRKWLYYDILRTVELETDVTSIVDGTTGNTQSKVTQYAVDEDNFRTQYDLYTTGPDVFVGVPFRSASSYDTEYRFSTILSFTAVLSPTVDKAWVMLGYKNRNQAHASRHSGLYVCISTKGDVSLLVIKAGQDGFAATLTSDSIEYTSLGVLGTTSGNRLQVQLWYDGSTHGLNPTEGAEVTVQVDDLDNGATLSKTLRLSFTTERTNDTYLDPWWADSWVITTPSLAVAQAVPAFASNDSIVKVKPETVNFVDPSVDANVRHLPILQPNVSNDEGFLRASIDYDLLRHPQGLWAYIKFEDQPASRLWAEAVALDGKLMQKMFAPLTGIADLLESSDTLKLKTQIIGALYGLISGPHLGPLSSAIGGLLGAPIAVRPGVVKSFTSLGGQPAIVMEEVDRERIYPYPPGLQTTVEIGDLVERFDPLVEMPVCHDWVSAPVRLAEAVSHEVQKYSRVLTDVQVEYLMAEFRALPRPLTGNIIRLFSSRFSERIRRYLLNAIGVWCGLTDVLINITSKIHDDLELTDYASLSGRRDHYVARIVSMPPSPQLASDWDNQQPDDFVNLRVVESLYQDYKPATRYMVGQQTVANLNALSPGFGDAYIVSGGGGVLTAGTLTVADGDIVNWIGYQWSLLVENVGGVPPENLRVVLHATEPLIAPYTFNNPSDMLIYNGIDVDGASGSDFVFTTLEFDRTTYPRDRTQLTAREALTGYNDPRYNVGSDVYGDDPPDPDACPQPLPLYDQAEIWVMDSRVTLTASYTGVDNGPQVLRVYKEDKTLSAGESHTFNEPDYWDECEGSEVNLDFSRAINSPYVPII